MLTVCTHLNYVLILVEELRDFSYHAWKILLALQFLITDQFLGGSIVLMCGCASDGGVLKTQTPPDLIQLA